MISKAFYTKWPAILWSAFVLVAMLAPLQRAEEQHVQLVPHLDKAVHFVLFAVLTRLWLYHIPAAPRYQLLLFALALSYGISLECLQMLPGIKRDFSYADLLANALGCLFAFTRINKKPR